MRGATLRTVQFRGAEPPGVLESGLGGEVKVGDCLGARLLGRGNAKETSAGAEGGAQRAPPLPFHRGH